MSIRIGSIATRNRIFLAPMSGVTDEPFRRMAQELGAGLVVSEMVASQELVGQRPDVLRRTAGAGRIHPLVIQLVGRDVRWMAEGATIAQELGAEVIDINMGCPAREVTGGMSGSALMRDLDHAQRLIDATVGSSKVPVTLKMRLGWDDSQRNAPDLARRAEQSGVAMVTVHGRTRCQFYKGKADWQAIRAVRGAIRIPLIANGDLMDEADAGRMLRESGADGLMIGRGAYGRPWAPAVLADALDKGTGRAMPSLGEQRSIVLRHYEEMLLHYGRELGVKVARKHLGWYVEDLRARRQLNAEQARSWRHSLVSSDSPAAVQEAIGRLYDALEGAAREAA
jgi:nifR3 family TIM-barrel protein